MKRGFTLIELLIVIAVLGVLSVGVLTAINVTGNINKANLAKAKTFSASVKNSLAISQVGEWSFDDQTNPAKDTSGYGNDGTLQNQPVWTSAADCELGFGGCLNFNGSDHSISVPDSNSVRLGAESFSISVWVKTTTGGGASFVSKAASSNTSYGLESAGPGLLDLIVAQSGSNNIDWRCADTEFKDGRWHHIVGTYDNPGRVAAIYLDGVKLSCRFIRNAGFGAINTDSNAGLQIGRDDIYGGFFGGTMDEVGLYNQTLTAYQIQSLYAQGLIRHVVAKK